MVQGRRALNLNLTCAMVDFLNITCDVINQQSSDFFFFTMVDKPCV